MRRAPSLPGWSRGALLGFVSEVGVWCTFALERPPGLPFHGGADNELAVSPTDKALAWETIPIALGAEG